MTADPNEMVYVRNEELGATAQVARSALRQFTTQGWMLVEDEAEVASGNVARGNIPAGADPDELVLIRNEELDATVTVPRSAVPQHRLSGWYVEGEAPDPSEAQPIVRDGEFDPTGTDAKAVVEYLKTADDAERERVLAVEQANQNRKSIVTWEPPADAEGKGDS